MDNQTLKRMIAQNIADCRRKAGMTQVELAERLNYSDKAVSKWERGESMPDVLVLKTIADLFGVTVDALISDGSRPPDAPVTTPGDPEAPSAESTDRPVSGEEAAAVSDVPASVPQARRRIGPETVLSITLMSILSVWAAATATFVMLDLFLGFAWPHCLPFFCALPVSLTVWLVLDCVLREGGRKYIIISLLLWSVLAGVHLSLLCFGINVWQVYLIGVPGTAVVWLCRGLVKGIKKNHSAG